MKGHNWGKCRKCDKFHKSDLGQKRTGQALKNLQESGRKKRGQKRIGRGIKITGQALKNIQEAARKPERNIKIKQAMKKKIENGWVYPKRTGQALHNLQEAGIKRRGIKLTGQMLKNRQEGCKKIRGKTWVKILGSKEKADERIRKQKEAWKKMKENGWESPLKHKSIEEIMGNKEKADEVRIKLSEAAKNRIKNQKSIIYNNISFTSNQELLGYKFCETITKNFIYQFYICNYQAVDFGFINPITKKLELVWELHPENRWWKDTPENRNIYEKERRKLLDDNGYTDVLLIVTYDLSEEAKNKITEMIR